MILIDFFHQLDLFLLETLQIPLGLLFLLADLDDGLSLFGVNACKFVLPVLHVPLLGSLRLFRDFVLLVPLRGEEVPLHFFELFVVLVGDDFDLARIIEFDQVNGLLDVLQLLLVAHAQLLVASAQILYPLLLVTVVSHFLDQRTNTHWLILLTSTFFWMVSLVSCLCFFTPSFYFCSCCLNSYTRFFIVYKFSLCFFKSFFSLTRDN